MIGVGLKLRFALVLGLVGFTSAVHAQSDEDERVEAEFSDDEAATLESAARTLFESGRVAYSEARYEDALSRFERAYAISPHHLLLYNIAQTQERLRRDADAIATFERFLETAPEGDIRATAERRLARLRASVAPPPEEVAELAIAAEQPEIQEPPESSKLGLVLGITISAVVLVVTAIVLGVVLRDDSPGEVQGTVGDVIRTLRANQ